MVEALRDRTWVGLRNTKHVCCKLASRHKWKRAELAEAAVRVSHLRAPEAVLYVKPELRSFTRGWHITYKLVQCHPRRTGSSGSS